MQNHDIIEQTPGASGGKLKGKLDDSQTNMTQVSSYRDQQGLQISHVTWDSFCADNE